MSLLKVPLWTRVSDRAPILSARSRASRQVVCNAEGLKAFVRNASEKAAVLAASALIAGVSDGIRLS